MLTCKEAAELISRDLDQRLSRWQRVNLRLHLMMCGACSAYQRQLEGLHRLFRKRFGGSRNGRGALPPEAQERIKRRLREKSHERC